MSQLTFMAVHAHPDDESLSTGGIFARYAAEGIRTVLVVCTDGGAGDGEKGSKPGDSVHDSAAVVEERRTELERSCAVLGVSHLERLGYLDSGMMGWPQNDAPGSFWTTPVAEAAGRLAALMEHYQPQVVVTYDPNGFYGHPDHIQAHRVTMAAAESTAIPEKVYWTAMPRSAFAQLARRMEELGVEFPRDEESDEPPGPREEWGTPDDEITAIVDVSAHTDRKYESLECHTSQADNIFFLKMGKAAFGELMGREAFVRVQDTTGAPTPEDDLFAGLRDS